MIKDSDIDKTVSIIEPVNIYGVKIGAGSFVGPFVEIQKNVVIGKNTRIQSHTFICERTSIGDGCFIAHGVCFINDSFQDGKLASISGRELQGATIKNNVLIGSNSTIMPVNICNDVVIGAGAVVTKNIIEPGKYVGNPAKKII